MKANPKISRFRPIKLLPLLVFAISLAFVYQAWWRQQHFAGLDPVLITYSGGALCLLLTLLLCWLLVRGRERALRYAQALSAELAERQNVQKALEESEERWKFALEGAGDGVWDWHVAENKVYASPRWKEMLGYGRDELGDSLEEWESHIHSDDLVLCYQAMSRHLKGETPVYVSEHRMRCKGGEYRWFQDRGMIIARDESGKPLRVIGTHSDITERKQAERKLAENESRLRGVLETTVDAIIVIDGDGIIQLFNPAAERIFGYGANEVLGRNVKLLMPEPFRSAHDEYLRHHRETGETKIIGIGREVVGLRKNGEEFPLDLSVGEMRVNGRRQFAGVLRDISERKRAEGQLQKSESKLRLVMDNIAEVFWMADVDSEQTYYVSPGYERIWRHSCQELYENPQSFIDAIHPDDREKVKANLATEKSGQPFECEYRIVWPDGSIRWIRDRGFPVPSEDGPVRQYVGLAEDITELKRAEQLEEDLRITEAVAAERKRAEEKLQRQKERYQRLLNSIGEGIFGLDIQGRCTFCNPAALCLLGYESAEQLVGKDIHWLIHHSHADGSRCETKDCGVYQAILRNEITHDAEDVFWRHDGSPFSVEYWSYPQHENGEATGAVVTFSDITQRKEVEKSRLLAAKVFQTSSEAIVVTDADNTIISVNPAFSTITGYSAEEAIGQNPRILKSGRHDDAFYRDLWNSLLDTGHWEGEIWDRRKNGEIYPKWTYINAIKVSGKLTNYVAIFSDITERKATEEHIQRLAHYDVLTGLPNRLLFHARLDQALATAKRNDSQVALMFIDLDRFKHINDSLGHAVGDQLLVSVAMRLQASLREIDTVARLGGDEFVVILEASDVNRATLVAQKLLQELAHPHLLGTHNLVSTPSIGIALYPSQGQDAETLVKRADAAMYSAKEKGRNSYAFFSDEIAVVVEGRAELEGALRAALERREFEVFYQPKLVMASGRITGMEALVRWRHPEKGLTSPDRFIPLAEETGLIIPIGEWVLRTACMQAKAWQTQGHGALRVAINISARQLQEPNILAVVSGILEESGLSPECLELEITESLLMRDINHSIKVLGGLKSLGVSIAVDDFGTGYSSLSYLKRLPIDVLKIDQSFVRDISSDPGDRAIIQAIISLAHALNLEAVAEGVETQEQEDFLLREDCQIMQGYFLGRPMPAEDFEALIKRHAYS